jgi:hypothetical protein
MLLWALLEDVWWDDERARIIAEMVDTFGEHLADRLAAATPPEHRVLCQRLGNSPYAGMVAFSGWVLGDVDNDLI